METDPYNPSAGGDWSSLAEGQQVTFYGDSGHVLSGVVHMRSSDASVIWMYLNEGGGRLMLHRGDGYRVDRT
ncbi:hypothetical protein [Arthrobacter castelli]|uniref:hypothetical protein n=1 Tax=Arthrobacter castelli TaxID=271431 RepID=UPI0003F7644E|nr:hypothetical protein [Arthrobacter castelli]